MVAVNYLWNPINDNIVREFDDAGNTIAEYTTEPDLYGNVVSQFRNGQTTYLVSDGQGNTTELTNDAGNVTDTIRYSAFGEVTQRTGTTEIPFQYVGKKSYYHDLVTGEHCVRRRHLNTRLGRWYAVDPLPYIVGIISYDYCGSNPIALYDPSGLAPLGTCRWYGGDDLCSGQDPSRQKVQRWGCIDWILHYYFGGGSDVNIGEHGLIDDFKRAVRRDRAKVFDTIAAIVSSTDRCKSAGVGIDHFEGSGEVFASVFAPLCLSVGPFGRHYLKYWYSCDLKTKCECCPDMSVRPTQASGKCVVNFRVKDEFTNPGDLGGSEARSDIEGYRRCVKRCRDDSLPGHSDPREIAIIVGYCIRQCERKYLTSELEILVLPMPIPYYMVANWSETIGVFDARGCR